MKIGLFSDTHGFLDPRIPGFFADCQEVWHAGDLGDESLLDVFSSSNQNVRAVYGNIDGHEVRARYPEEQLFTIGGAKVWMIHIGGYPPKYNKAIKSRLDEQKPDIFVCGHSHILKVIPDKERGLLHLNPGAAGKHGFHKVRTLITFHIDEGRPHSLHVIELGARA